MSANVPCPSPEDLARFVAGREAGRPAVAIEEHLTTCRRCVDVLGRLKDDDGLVEALRKGKASVGPDETALVEGLIERLKERTQRDAAGSEEATLPPADTAGGSGPQAHDYLAPPERPGELGRLGPYRVLKILGAGGMGVVYQAEDVHLLRLVALKVMNPALATSEAGRERFLLEVRAVAAIEHEHIVTIHQVGEDRGVPYFAMPFLRGESLEDRLQREGCLPLAEVLRIGQQVAAGLEAAHERGLIHRDVKPANVWLEEGTGRVKILDFGLVRTVGYERGLTKPGSILGTPEYMAPEQGRGDVGDQRTDLFSLGCVLYRMGTGELPFQGADLIATIMAVATQEPTPPRSLNPDLPPLLCDLIGKLLCKDPADRPTSAGEVAEALQALADDQPELARRRVGAFRPRRPRGGKGWRRVLLAGAILGLAAAAVIVWLVAFRPAGNEGEFTLEASNAATAELIERLGGVSVRERRTGREHPLRFDEQRARVRLPLGQYELTTPGDPTIEFSQTSFALVRGATAASVQASIMKAPADVVKDFDVLLDGDSTEYQAWCQRMEYLSMRPVYFSVHVIADRPRFSAVAITHPDRHWRAQDNSDWTSYAEVTWKQLRSQGFRELLAGPYPLASDTHYLSYWVNDGMTAGWSESRMPEQQYRAALQKQRDRGYRLLGACALLNHEGELVFQATAGPDGGLAWEEHHDLTAVGLQQLLDGCKARRWRPDYLQAYQDRDGTRFLAILVENPQDVPWSAQLNLSLDECRQEIQVQKSKSLRPLAVAGYAEKGQTRYAAAWLAHQPAAGDPLATAKVVSRPGWKVIWEADGRAFEAWVKDLRAAGFRPIVVNGHTLGGKARLAGVAVKSGKGGTAWETYLDRFHEYPERFRRPRGRNYWPASQTVYYEGNVRRIASIWTPYPFEEGTPLSDVDMTPAGFETKLKQAGDQGEGYPSSVSTYPVGGSYQVSALFAPYPDGLKSWCRVDVTADEYQTFLETYKSQGYRPISVSVCPVQGKPRFTAVMVADGKKHLWEAQKGLSSDQLSQELRGRQRQRQRPSLIAGYPDAGESRYVVVWVRE